MKLTIFVDRDAELKSNELNKNHKYRYDDGKTGESYAVRGEGTYSTGAENTTYSLLLQETNC